MRHEAINTSAKPAPSSVILGRWLAILWKFGVRTPPAEISNEEVDLILARVSEMAGDKEESDASR